MSKIQLNLSGLEEPLVPGPRSGLTYTQPRAGGARALGAKLFEDITAHVGKFVVLPNAHAATVIAAWVIHTHLYDSQASTPRLIVTASGKNSGKSILCEVMRPMCSGEEATSADEFGMVISKRMGAIMSADATPAYVIGCIELANTNGHRVTIIMDESDVEGSSGADMVALRKTINSGYRPSGSAGRMSGGKLTRRSTYAPFIISGIKGNIHETTLSRAVIVHMRAADAEDTFEYYKAHKHDMLGDALRARIEQWADEIRHHISDAEPEMEGVYNRDREVWEPLVQIGDLAGEKWATRVREAMYFWLNGGTKREARNSGEAVLSAMIELFTNLEVDRMFTTDLVGFLRDQGFPDLDQWGLAKVLKAYDVKAKQIRIDGEQTRGYQLEDLERAWDAVTGG